MQKYLYKGKEYLFLFLLKREYPTLELKNSNVNLLNSLGISIINQNKINNLKQELAQAKAERAEAVSNIVVEVDGMKFDGDEEAQTRMGRTIAAAIALGVDINTYTQTWVLADNTVAMPTIKQLAQALKLAGEEQTKLWTVPYEETSSADENLLNQIDL